MFFNNAKYNTNGATVSKSYPTRACPLSGVAHVMLLQSYITAGVLHAYRVSDDGVKDDACRSFAMP